MHFPHNGKNITIDQISFVSPNMDFNHPNSMKVPYMKVVSIFPQVNYMVSCPIPSTTNEKELLTICLTSLELDPVVDQGDLFNGGFGASYFPPYAY
jgi:hypothetical protein